MKIRKTKASTKHRQGKCRSVDCLDLLEQRLGFDPGSIVRLRGESDVFSEICADYEECCGKLRSLKQKGAAAIAHLHDYLEMRDQLERELERYVKGACSRRERGS